MWHAIIVNVFSFEGELLEKMPGSRDEGEGLMKNASIGSNFAQGRIPLCNEAQLYAKIQGRVGRRLIGQSDDFVV